MCFRFHLEKICYVFRPNTAISRTFLFSFSHYYPAHFAQTQLSPHIPRNLEVFLHILFHTKNNKRNWSDCKTKGTPYLYTHTDTRCLRLTPRCPPLSRPLHPYGGHLEAAASLAGACLGPPPRGRDSGASALPGPRPAPSQGVRGCLSEESHVEGREGD